MKVFKNAFKMYDNQKFEQYISTQINSKDLEMAQTLNLK